MDEKLSRHPEAAELVGRLLEKLVAELSFLASLRMRMLGETGTRLVDWVDHLVVPQSHFTGDELIAVGFEAATDRVNLDRGGSCLAWHHHEGLFPVLLVSDREDFGIGIRSESVSDFLAAHRLESEIAGPPGGPLRIATVVATAKARLTVVERHGYRGFDPPAVAPETIVAALLHGERFRYRKRDFAHVQDGLNHAANLFDGAAALLGQDWACDLFFAAERWHWQHRNRAARIQKMRQDQLGLGWANHDHHTYRCSREHFAGLISLLERMGFRCRERFYGGAEAGWGAQVLEQPQVGVVIFADVDLSPREVTGDFAHEGLDAKQELGTVGLWCALHGEAILQAGLHHLECQFDFDAARSQLAGEGITTMHPFTDFDYLKQAFTEGEVWKVDPNRIEAAVNRGAISEEQAKRFAERGVIGSHLEILQRDDGYKGFNQTGISEIIRETDPRLAES
jgi:hypothetical protein